MKHTITFTISSYISVFTVEIKTETKTHITDDQIIQYIKTIFNNDKLKIKIVLVVTE